MCVFVKVSSGRILMSTKGVLRWVWESERRERGLCGIWGSTLPWDLSQTYPCTPHPSFRGGYERGREWATFLGIISPGEWRLHGDQTLILMRRRLQIRSCSEAPSNTLPGFYFISVMETQHSSLLFGSWDGSCRSEERRGTFTIKMTAQDQNTVMSHGSRSPFDVVFKIYNVVL